MAVKKVVFRCNNDMTTGDGTSHFWFGEDSYELGETLAHGVITNIEYIGEKLGIQVYVDNSIYCTIPMGMVCRMYHTWKKSNL